jgi:excinuclease ABC subunit A
VIDLGPEGGAGGGQIVVCGPPAELIKTSQNSYTARCLREYLQVEATSSRK